MDTISKTLDFFLPQLFETVKPGPAAAFKTLLMHQVLELEWG